jgi:predicted ATPase
MISRIEALNYKALRFVQQDISRFQIMVGPNASGKSTFLDVVSFLGDMVQIGLLGAIEGDAKLGVAGRAPDAKHLTWMRNVERFELAVEFGVPKDLVKGNYTCCRYEVAIEVLEEPRLVSENLFLKPLVLRGGTPAREQDTLFPRLIEAPESIVIAPRKLAPVGWKKVIGRGEDPMNVIFNSETTGWKGPFRLGVTKSALANLTEDEGRFPVATWMKRELAEGVQKISLSGEAMRKPSAPGRSRGYLPDGSNLPWVVAALERDHPKRFQAWIEHVREALPDLRNIITREREDDRHRYLVLQYITGLEAPSWLVSDGTLRLLALTLLAYIPELQGTLLVEEPENGIHPKAVEVVQQALSSIYDAQILCATHSPVVVSMAEPHDILCFARDENGATDIVPGNEHPALRQWRGEVDLGTLFASGVIG